MNKNRIAVISDIHSNPKALRKALSAAADDGCGEVVCLGDVVGYGYDPVECIRILNDAGELHGMKCTTMVMGNHDAAVCGMLNLGWFNEFAADGVVRCRKVLGEQEKNWLKWMDKDAKKEFKEFDTNLYFAHGSYARSPYEPDEPFPYMDGLELPWANFSKMRQDGARHHVLFVGHTHWANVYLNKRGSATPLDVQTVNNVTCVSKAIREDLVPSFCYRDDDLIVNVGSVGYPRQQPWTVFAIVDLESKVVKYRKLPFAFREYAEDLDKAGIKHPSWLGMWYDVIAEKWYDEENEEEFDMHK